MQIENRALTALHRKELSAPYKILIENYIFKENCLLDYGCGYCNDVQILKEKGYNIIGYDKYISPFNDEKLLSGSFDCILCNYVMNVIEEPLERKSLLLELLQRAPIIYLALRCDWQAIKPNWQSYKDGYITGRGTFQKIYNKEEALVEFTINGHLPEIISLKNHMIILAIKRIL